VPEFKPDAAQTIAFAAGVVFLGLMLKKFVRILDRLNLPAPVVGGLLAATLILILRQAGTATFHFDTTLQPILQNAFFTTIGMSASVPLLRRGGVTAAIFLSMSTALCLVQNFIGMGIASAFDLHKLVGVMAGSVTLVGGPATGLAFAPQFESAGVTGADSLAVAAATFGICCGGLLGGPVSTWLVEKRVHQKALNGTMPAMPPEPEEKVTLEVESEDTPLLRNLLVLSLAMGLGVVVSQWIQSRGITLPSYIGAMIVASALRNLDDRFRWFRISQPVMDLIGHCALLLFLATALLNLKLWELAHLAVPLIVILVAQVAAMGLFAVAVSFPVMGRDYESAVMAGGLIGFVLGTTANALTNMRAIVGRYGAAPRAFLVVPLVGAFFIDFVNALIITVFLNWLAP
jgi:ESS family glutamate:Na+ symporter